MYQIRTTPVNLIMIAIFYQILLFLGDSTFFGGFKLGDGIPDLSVVDAKFYGCRSDGDFILYDVHECLVEIMRIHIWFFC